MLIKDCEKCKGKYVKDLKLNLKNKGIVLFSALQHPRNFY